jgi:hypothetical protein
MSADRTPSDALPPDPWADDGIDLWALEQGELLAADDSRAEDPRWDSIEGPTLDAFDDAAAELDECEDEAPCGRGLIGNLRPWMAAIALLVAVAMALTYALR